MEEDYLHEFEGNQEILKYKAQYVITEGFQLNTSEDKLYIALRNLGILEWDLKSNQEIIISSDSKSQLFLDSLDIQLWSIVTNKKQFYPHLLRAMTVVTDTKRTTISTSHFLNDGSGSSGFICSFKDTSYYFYQNGEHILLANSDSIIDSGLSNCHFTCYIEYKDELWLGKSDYNGIEVYKDLSDVFSEKKRILLPDKFVSNFFEDNQGGLWVCTIENGVFYAPNSENRTYNKTSGFQEDFVKSISIETDTTLYVAHWNEGTSKLNHETENLNYSYSNPFQYQYNYDVHYDKKLDKLIITPYATIYNNNDKKIIESSLSTNHIKTFGSYNISSNPYKGNYLLSGGSMVHFVDLKLDSVTWVSDPDYKHLVRVLDANYDNEGHIWVTKVDGLWNIINEEYIRPTDLDSILYQRIECAEFLSNNQIVLGTKGNGVVIGYEKDKTQKITTEDGLTANNIENIHIDSLDQIWVGTLNGLNRIRLTEDGPDIKVFTKKHGLPSDEITKIQTQEDITWVATNKGLCKMMDMDIDSSTTIPLLKSFSVNDSMTLINYGAEFSHGQNNIAMEYVALDYKAQGNILYRYRLENERDWKTTTQTQLNFSNLSHGNYDIEIQAQNEDRFWSPSLRLSFVIKRPWWLQSWFLIISIGSLVSLIYLYYKNRVRKILISNALQVQLVDLERSALQAQMNPHFIFNVLNSVQAAISADDKEKANSILAKFAKLIRTTLNNVRSDSISLQEELQYLSSYVELEKTRHHNKFEFTIEVGDEIDPFDIVIPPMLIQPFIENAIKHGMKDNEQGVIKLSIKKREEALEVNITDNGKGVHQEEKNHEYEPLAMKITQRRLKLTQPDTQENSFEVITLKDRNGSISGTRVTFKIKTH